MSGIVGNNGSTAVGPIANPLAEDLDHVLEHTRGLWEELRGGRLFITGGTGFFGCWLLESFVWACERLALGAEAVVLTRRPEAFARKTPHLAGHPAVRMWRGDVRSFEFPEGPFSHVIHAATESSTSLNEDDPLIMLDTIIEGTRRALEFARQCGAKKFLLTSSGAVYGRQPPELTHVPEEYTGAPDSMNQRSAYGEGKRVAELLCSIYAPGDGMEVKIARCFAFVRPYLTLNAHFAIGNFIRDVLARRPIVVKGDGTPYRSYLYAADLAVWLWVILFRGCAGTPYNVGSERALCILDVARLVSSIGGGGAVTVRDQAVPGRLGERYVPSTEKACKGLGLRTRVDLETAIKKTVEWHSKQVCRDAVRSLATE